MSEPTKIEYQVRTVERYIITRYQEDGPGTAACCGRGEYSSPHVAHEVAYALAKEERERLGWLPGDARIQFPRHPDDEEAERVRFATSEG